MPKNLQYKPFVDKLLLYMQDEYNRSLGFRIFTPVELNEAVPFPPSVNKKNLAFIIQTLSGKKIKSVTSKRELRFVCEATGRAWAQGYVLIFLWDWLVKTNLTTYNAIYPLNTIKTTVTSNNTADVNDDNEAIVETVSVRTDDSDSITMEDIERLFPNSVIRKDLEQTIKNKYRNSNSASAADSSTLSTTTRPTINDTRNSIPVAKTTTRMVPQSRNPNINSSGTTTTTTSGTTNYIRRGPVPISAPKPPTTEPFATRMLKKLRKPTPSSAPLEGTSALNNIPSYDMVKTDINYDDDNNDDDDIDDDDDTDDDHHDDDTDDDDEDPLYTTTTTTTTTSTYPHHLFPSSAPHRATGVSTKINNLPLSPLHQYFYRSNVSSKAGNFATGATLLDGTNLKYVKESALFCQMDNSHTIDGRENMYGMGDYCRTRYGEASTDIYLNVHEPFCLATIGVQGGGKSHTMACVIENCLLPILESNIVNIKNPMSVLVLHYDQNIASVCEATGLIGPSPLLEKYVPNLYSNTSTSFQDNNRIVNATSSNPYGKYALPKEKMIVLVSPTYYQQRKSFYGDYCIVKPLLFKWNTLSADHIKRIMRIKDTDNQLYMATLLSLLRDYQREAIIPSFSSFVQKLKDTCNLKGQAGPLNQRLALLESIIWESTINQGIASQGSDLLSCCQPGTLVIVDLTDPLLASDEANCIFQVLAEQYRTIPSLNGVGKLLALDEAHKFMDGVRSDGLSESIVNIARLMRHDGIRLAVSTQSPTTLAPELLELVTVAVLHRFHSRDWFLYLSKKIPLSPQSWDALMNLEPGHALIFSSQNRIQLLQNKFTKRGTPMTTTVTVVPSLVTTGSTKSNVHPQENSLLTVESSTKGTNSETHFDINEEENDDTNEERHSTIRILPLGLELGKNILHVHIRPRITADRGSSRKNTTTVPIVPRE